MKMDRYPDSEVQALLILYPKEEIKLNFDVAYVTLALLLAVWTQTEKSLWRCVILGELLRD